MATTTYIGLGGSSATGRFKEAAKRAFARMIAARELEAHRQVALHMSNMDAATLERYGWIQADIKGMEKRRGSY